MVESVYYFIPVLFILVGSVGGKSDNAALINEVSEVNWQQEAQHLIEQLEILKEHIYQHQNILNELEYLRRQNDWQEKIQFVPKSSSKAVTGRTCEEIYAQDATLPSGNYFIDPDGPDGDEPFSVYCNMTDRMTLVGHDSENPIRIDQCSPPGCYSREIHYGTTIRQLQTLIQLSAFCQQYVRFNCLGVPFEFSNVVYGFWNNRNGEQRRYWAGRFLEEHTCRCGLEKNCNSTEVLCNCDALQPEATYDDGYITDKSDLPVMKLNFGRSESSASIGIHTLGKLECSGRPEKNAFPETCTDLWEAGVQVNGFYTFRKKIEAANGFYDELFTSFCDFSKLPGDSDQEKVIGANDVKSDIVYFFVKDNSEIVDQTAPIPFADEVLDDGDKIKDGVFTAPVSGFYFFAFNVPNSRVSFVTETSADEEPSVHKTEGSFGAALELEKDTQVFLKLDEPPSEILPRQFSGVLLKQTLFTKKDEL